MVVQRCYPLKPIKVLALTKYGRLGASSRLRFLQFVAGLELSGVQVTVQPLIPDAMLKTRYVQGSYGVGALVQAYAGRCRAMMSRQDFNLLWVEKEALPWLPFLLELALLKGRPYVLDFDDAVFHNYDQNARPWIRQLYGNRLDRLMAGAALVVAGNSYLAARARAAGALRVEILPTSIDLDHYPIQPVAPQPHPVKDSPPCIVWVGSPTTARYLSLLREPLQTLAIQRSFALRLIGCDPMDIPGVRVEAVPWSEATEFDNISACDIGVMPLMDSPWEQGKCGYKLIQYMACGLPVVASNVGVNSEIVQPGKSGFLAGTSAEWVSALGELLESYELRHALGRAGRASVESTYCIQKTGPQLAQLLRSVVTAY
jgi:glycosyltransferase involved in cell wall biosynthesis